MDLNMNEHGQRYSAENLLDTGLQLLETESIQQLTISALCKKMGVTKGSFYHHFKNRVDFLDRMLDYWVQVWTIDRVQELSSSASALERYKKMVEVSVDYPMNVEISIRAWAQQDTLAQKYLQKVDNMRIECLRLIFEELCGNPERAAVLAKIDYAIFVGVRMVSPPIVGNEAMEIVNLLLNELYNIPVSG
ncbi:TetR/AcrR family transcriptional regulator [Maridesulfovibrio zosterae]|uniref:TetR/AcrR family transcriptional regulator n=1 Tax=Maridesulfovibrio zosterae TaxID=82171 RepID=UPI000418D509|nr:TetR/AcrR family transcriptional regulator [Maridesulfovibrio zosterae]